MLKRLALLSAIAGLAAAAVPAAASAEVVWLCKPGEEPNPCRESLETTVDEPDGSSRVENPPLADRPAIDCFYVYPTVSGESGTNASKDKDPEILAIARYQAARFSQRCRMFAPVYRQLTLNSIFTGSASARTAGARMAYGDVLEAWREYLERHNDGRGVVLIGHSQGTFMLRKLVREQVDPDPGLRGRLVSALLLGGNVAVRKGSRAGGDFQRIPACARTDEVGCVIGFSAFNETPPEDARFGRPPTTDTLGSGFPHGPEYEVLCNNPASLAANETTPLTTYVRTEPFPGLLGVGLVVMYGGPPPTAPTPWLQPRDRYTGQCRSEDGANFFFIEGIGDARRLNPSPDSGWGLHLADVNIALGELIGVVSAQEAAYLADSPPDCLARRGRARGRRVGRLRLGRTRRQLIAAAGTDPVVSRRRFARWCVQGFSGSVGAAFSSRRRAVLIAATARGYRLRRVRVGKNLGVAQASFARVGRRGFVIARGGRVRAVGVASRALLAQPGRLRRLARRSAGR